MTLDQLLDQADRNGVPPERAVAVFERASNNGDQWICQVKLRGELHYNFIDNVAVGTVRQ